MTQDEKVAEQAIAYMEAEYPSFCKLKNRIGIIIIREYNTYPTKMCRAGLINMMSDLIYHLKRR